MKHLKPKTDEPLPENDPPSDPPPKLPPDTDDAYRISDEQLRAATRVMGAYEAQQWATLSVDPESLTVA